MDLNIEKFIAALPESKRELALKVRDIILKSDKTIEETIKWGNLTFVSNGINLGFIYTYKSVPYINLGYIRAVDLSDPKKLLEGTGKGMRHIKIGSGKDIDKKQITSWTKEAVQLNAMSKAKPKVAKKTTAKKSVAKKVVNKTGKEIAPKKK
jgi:hypothetical protein